MFAAINASRKQRGINVMIGLQYIKQAHGLGLATSNARSGTAIPINQK
jgi:hypothetical protein